MDAKGSRIDANRNLMSLGSEKSVALRLVREDPLRSNKAATPGKTYVSSGRVVQVVLLELSGAFVGSVNQTLEPAQSGIGRCASFCEFVSYLVAVFDPDDLSRSHISGFLCFDCR
jgi:hypothetical protein